MSKNRKNVSTAAPKRRKGRGVTIFYAFLVVVMLALVWFSFGQNVLGPSNQSKADDTGVPQYIGTLKRQTLVQGPQALSQINQLHGTDIKLVAGYKAEYAPPYGGERATVWVGSAASENEAAQLLQRMAEAIGKGSTPFGVPQQINISGHPLYQVQGPGGDSYFYQSHESVKDVVWITVESNNPRAIVEKAVMIF